MKCADTLEQERPATVAAAANQVRLPMGLLGFEQIKDYVLLASPDEAPFAWLKVEDNNSLAFVVVNPFLVAPDYQPDIPKSDVEFLGLEEASDAILLNIVTIQGPQRATINLKGPIVVNRHTRIGKQVIINNAANYSVQFPLPVEETVA
jgi:flagellar assembly factor FliW